MSEEQIKPEKQRMRRVGDDLEDEPDAVDIKQPGEKTEGADIDETWHRAGGKASGMPSQAPTPPSQSEEKKD